MARCWWCGEEKSTHVPLTPALEAAFRLGGREAVLELLMNVPLGDLEHSWVDGDLELLKDVLENMGCRLK